MSHCSVVMVSYHTGPVLFAAVRSVLRQKELAELVIVNNGNPPDVLARLQQMALTEPRLVIAAGGGNGGFAKGCNIGVAYAGGEFVLLLNPDCLLPPGALAGMAAALGETPGAVLAGCRLLNPDGSEQRGGRRQLLTPKTALVEALSLHRLSRRFRRLNNHEAHMPEETHEVEAISGAFMFLRRADYQRLGGLDENYFLHVEDLDFCLRVRRDGGKILCVPGVQATHMRSTSRETASRLLEWHKAKGFVYYFGKHFRKQLTPPGLWLMRAAVWARFALKTGALSLCRLLCPPRRMSHGAPEKKLMALAAGLAELPARKDFDGKAVLVTGATSQVGLCVVRRLIAGGASVLAISRSEPIPFRHEQLRWIRGDLTDRQLHLEDYLVDMAVHCAPLWHLPPVIELLAKSEARRVVAFGSTSVFGKALSRNRHEKALVDRLIKAETETQERCREHNVQWTILRPTLIYGVGLDLNVTSVARFIDRFGFFPVYPPAFGRRQPVHADDLAQAALQSALAPASFGHAYNLSGGEILTYHEMLERIFAVCGRKPRIWRSTLLPFALDVAGRALRQKHINGEIARRMNDDLVFFHDEAARDFGFRPRPFLSGGMRDIEGF